VNRPREPGIGAAAAETAVPANGTVAVILNASAGRSDKHELADRLVLMFEAEGVNARVILACSGEEIVAAARRLAAEGASALVAGGGDGTVNTVASIALESGMPFGVLPLGTLNHFAKDLGLPLDIDCAVRAIAHGRVERVDVGDVNGRIFVNNSSLGIYPRIVRHRTRKQREGMGKWAAFAWAAMRVLRRHIFLAVGLVADDKRLSRRTPFVFVGNNEYQMESLRMGSRTCLSAGRLSVVVARRPGRWGLVRLALRALLGRLHAAKDFDVLCTRELEVETPHAQLDVATDGEVTRMGTPLRYRVLPGALQVIVLRGS
jgi:diacylglycerol kinase family enzyme